MRRIALLLAVVALAACNDSTSPNGSAVGNYSLRTINGSNLPYTFQDNSVLVSDQLTLNSNGTYVDMTSKLPLVDPEKITVPTIVMRGQWDGIASFDDLVKFFEKLPNPDQTFSVMAGISHASFQQINYRMVYHILYSWFTQPEPLYRG